MLSVEMIKKGCEFAEGFERISKDLGITNTHIVYEPNEKEYVIFFSDVVWGEVYYPLFLQRVIEGLKLKYKEKLISINNSDGCWYCSIYDGWCSEMFDTPEQCKGSAIKYIFEQLEE